MAQIVLPRRVAEQSGRLPRICMQCGAPATTEVSRSYTTDKVNAVPLPEPDLGCLMIVLFPLFLLLKLISWGSAKTMTVQTPLCDKHAHGWFTSLSLEASSITEESITLTGVSEEFARAWADQAQVLEAEPKLVREIIRIRCPQCRALNAEKAKYCDQCRAALS